MKSKRTIIFLAMMFALMLAACGGGAEIDNESAITTRVAQTQQISALETAVAEGNADQGQDEGTVYFLSTSTRSRDKIGDDLGSTTSSETCAVTTGIP